jgi:predicted HNH restriction endonuclease
VEKRGGAVREGKSEMTDENRISESELIFPTLRFLNEKGNLKTSELIKLLEAELKPTGRDAELLKGRKDTHFSQKVRNLKSHNTLIRAGLATYQAGALPGEGIYSIASKGREFFEQNEPVFDAFQRQGFSKKTIDNELKKKFEDVIVEEGSVASKNTKFRKRSQELRRIAMKELRSADGRLHCKVCDFDFLKVYGERGRDYIEIHHLEPVHTYEIEGRKQELTEALKKLVPLCSNCHSMIHRERNNLFSVEKLREIVSNGSD